MIWENIFSIFSFGFFFLNKLIFTKRLSQVSRKKISNLTRSAYQNHGESNIEEETEEIEEQECGSVVFDDKSESYQKTIIRSSQEGNLIP